MVQKNIILSEKETEEITEFCKAKGFEFEDFARDSMMKYIEDEIAKDFLEYFSEHEEEFDTSKSIPFDEVLKELDLQDLDTNFTFGETLKSFYMDAFLISEEYLAKRINYPLEDIKQILNDEKKIDLDLSIKLGKLFEQEEDFFINLQNEIEIQKLLQENEKEYQKIKPLDY